MTENYLEERLILIHGLEGSSQGDKAILLRSKFPRMLTPDFRGSLDERMRQLEYLLGEKSNWTIIDRTEMACPVSSPVPWIAGGPVIVASSVAMPVRIAAIIVIGMIRFKAVGSSNDRAAESISVVIHADGAPAEESQQQ